MSVPHVVKSGIRIATRRGMTREHVDPLSRRRPEDNRFWRLLESPLIARLVGESVFDFYASAFSPALTSRRVVARVEATRDEAPSVKSFVLRPNGHFRGFRAGQHVNLTVEIDGVRHTRCYSPSSAPDATSTVVLTVKRHPAGRVSGWLHDRLRAGSWVELGQAFGDFTPPSDIRGKLLFIAGGSGITPLASVLRDLCARGAARDVVVLSYGRTASDLIFAEELRALAARHPGVRVEFVLTRAKAGSDGLIGRFSSMHVDRVAPDARERRTFVCGPRTLVDDVRALWKARDIESLLKTESFTPVESVDAGGLDAIVNVTAARSSRAFSATASSPLLVQAERAGLSPASGCRQGLCFSCTCRKRSGVVRNITTGALSSEPDEDIRLCISVPLSDVTLDL